MITGHRRSGLVLVLAIAGLLGCSSPQSLSEPGSPAAGAGMPDPAGLHAVQGISEDQLLGIDAASHSLSAASNGTALELLPAAGQPAWALYAFDPQGRSLDSLAVLIDVATGAEAWILLADFESGRWVWNGPYTNAKTLALDEARFVSPSGAALFGVVGSGSGSVMISALSIRSQSAQNQAPMAQLLSSLPGGDVPLSLAFDASGSSDSDGEIIEFAWDWDGDGGYDTISEDPQLSHQFTQPGIVQLKLRVTDDSFARSYATLSLNFSVAGNNPPLAGLLAAPDSGTVPLTVILDAAGSNAGGDSGDSIVLYEWDLNGDGAFEAYGQQASLSHNYTEPGALNVRLRVTDSAGNQAEDTALLTLSAPGGGSISADLLPTTGSGDAPYTVDFDATGSSSSGTIVLYEWDWEADGSWDAYGASPLISHVFSTPGIHSPLLRVSDNLGNQQITSSSFQVSLPGNNPPVADLLPASADGIAPLSVSFDAGASTAGGDSGDSIVLYEWDFDGDGAFEAYGTAPEVDHSYNVAGSYSPQVRVSDEAGNQDLASAAVEVEAGNQAPVAVLQASANECEAGDALNFFASSSYDSDGTVILHEWDLDGNGSYETDTGLTDHVSQTYNTPGLPFSVGLRIRDNDGYFASAEVMVSIHGWQRLTLDSTGLVGYHSSLALIGGKPAICYQQANSSDLRYAVSSSETGDELADWTIVTVDSAVSGGQYGSLCEVNGKPAISYYDGGLSDLKYALSSTASGASAADWSFMTLDSAGGQSTSLCVVDGNPAIAHYDSVNQDLRYRRSTTVDGASAGDWSQSVVIDSAGSVGNHCCLAVVNGAPAISYADSDNGDLKYAFSSTPSGALVSDWQAIIVDNTGGGHYSSLVFANGLPAIAYYNYGTEKLMYCISATAGGQAPGDWTKLVVDGTTTCGSYCSLALLSSNPAISYLDYASGDLELARSVTTSGASPYDWSQKQRADGDGTASGPNVGQFSSLAVLAGRPMIAYLDIDNADLKYAIRF